MKLITNLAATFGILLSFFSQASAQGPRKSLWDDTTATMRALADTSAVSPFLSLYKGNTKRDEKAVAISNYCECEKLHWQGARDTFYALAEMWPELECRPKQENLMDVLRFSRHLSCDVIPRENEFELSRDGFVLLMENGKLEEVEKKFTKESNHYPYELCKAQTKAMFPAYATGDPIGAYPQVKAVNRKEMANWDVFYREQVAPWAKKAFAQPSTSTRVSIAAAKQPDKKKELNSTVARVAAAPVEGLAPQTKTNTPRGIEFRYPITVSNIPMEKFIKVPRGGSTDLGNMVYGGIYHNYYAFIDVSGKFMKVDSSAQSRDFTGAENTTDRVKYRSQKEEDSLFINYSDEYKKSNKLSYRNFKRIVVFPNGKTVEVSEKYWVITNQAGKILASAKTLGCGGDVDRERTSGDVQIDYLGSGRYWLYRACEGTGTSMLLDQDAKIIARVPYRLGSVSHMSPRGGTPRYIAGRIQLSGGAVMDLNGRIVYKNEKYKIDKIIDKNILRATIDVLNEISVYAYINYRTGKVIYTALDYEKSGFVTPTAVK